VFQASIARRAVISCQTLSASEKLVLLAMLERTQGATAEGSQLGLAADCSIEERTVCRVLRDLRQAGWFASRSRGALPSVHEWSPTGPLAAAWTTPKMGIVRNADRVEPARPVTRSATAARRDVLTAAAPTPLVDALEVAHAEWRVRKNLPRDLPMPAATREQCEIVMADVFERCRGQSGVTPELLGAAFIADWVANFPGHDGRLAANWHPLAMIATQNCRDLVRLGARYMRDRLAYLDDAKMRRRERTRVEPEPIDHDELAAGAARVAAACGGAR